MPERNGSLSLSVIIAPMLDLDDHFILDFSRQTVKPDEVVFVCGKSDAALEQVCRACDIRFVLRSHTGSFTRRANIGLGFASGQVVCILRGTETFGPVFFLSVLQQFEGTDLGTLLLRSNRTPEGDLLLARRDCFLYGALDERFADDDTSISQWCELIYKGASRRYARFDGYREAVGADFGYQVKKAVIGQPRPSQAKKQLHQDATDKRPYFEDAPYEARAFWETHTRDYVKWEVFQPDEEEVRSVMEDTQPASVLELGCGAGRNFRYFPRTASCVGLDIAQNLLIRAKDKLDDHIRGMVCGSAVQLSFSDQSFDLVFADSTIQHVPPDQIESCVSEIIRVARREVCLIEFTREDPALPGFFSQVHIFQYDYEALFKRSMDLVYRKRVRYQVQPAIKEVFLFRKYVLD